MDSSMVSLIYVAALVAFFLVLVVLTITIIASRTRSDEDDETSEDEYDEENITSEDEEEYGDEEDTSDDEEEYGDENVTLEDEEEYGGGDGASDNEDDTSIDTIDLGDIPEDSAFVNTLEEDDVPSGDVTDELPEIPEDLLNVQNSDDAGTDTEESGEDTDLVFEDSAFVDSAFAPEPMTALTNEALNGSVREAVALGNAISQTGRVPVFGVAEALDKGTKKRGNGKIQSKSTVSSTDEFYWYNKVDVAEKPSYKTAEMYYHYFNLPKDCIESLVIEMYDCALVRTEEIRYIAYGIEPRAVSMKEILTSGNHNYIQQKKQKEPAEQDLVRIYEKWCEYVDRLFDVVEIHADKFTIDEIRSMLYEFGRNDVDILIEGM